MISTSESIACKNVVAKEYYWHYKDFGEAIEDFIRIVVEDHKLTLKGNLFYSLNNMPMDEMMYITMFAAVEEAYCISLKDLEFRSYFYIDNMLMLRFSGEYEALTEYAYAELLNFMYENNLEQVTPFFHELAGDISKQYVQIKVGIMPNEEEV